MNASMAAPPPIDPSLLAGNPSPILDAAELPLFASGAVADAIAEQGYCVVRNVLPADLVQRLQDDCREREAMGLFERAEIGGGLEKRLEPEVRGDHIHWWHRDQKSPSQAKFQQFMERLQTYLADELRLPLAEFEMHFAVYPPGAGYAAHLDQIRGRGFRLVSMTFYLNPGWKPEWGGQLRLHLADGPVDIEPFANTMVLFRSDTVLHEVRQTNQTRRTITSWFRSVEPGPKSVLQT